MMPIIIPINERGLFNHGSGLALNPIFPYPLLTPKQPQVLTNPLINSEAEKHVPKYALSCGLGST